MRSLGLLCQFEKFGSSHFDLVTSRCRNLTQLPPLHRNRTKQRRENASDDNRLSPAGLSQYSLQPGLEGASRCHANPRTSFSTPSQGSPGLGWHLAWSNSICP